MHETCGGNNLVRWIFLSGWNGGYLAGDSGLAESEEDGAEESCRLLIGIWLEMTKAELTAENRPACGNEIVDENG